MTLERYHGAQHSFMKDHLYILRIVLQKKPYKKRRFSRCICYLTLMDMGVDGKYQRAKMLKTQGNGLQQSLINRTSSYVGIAVMI